MKRLICFVVVASLHLVRGDVNPLEEFFRQRNINYLQNVQEEGGACWSALNASSDETKIKSKLQPVNCGSN